ncbi:MAG: hypothetical protein ACI8XO_004786 [Verrucomicrobiales bacterium]|jgi:hypothetical protein
MDHFEEKLASFEPRKPTGEQGEQILANAPVEKPEPDTKTKKVRKPRGRLLTIATSRWFLFAALPLLLFGTAGICAVSVEGQEAGQNLHDVQEMLNTAGETLDFHVLAPPPVADADNFMATPALHSIEMMEHPRDPEILAKHDRINALPKFRGSRKTDPGTPVDFGAYAIFDPDSDDEPPLISTLGGNPNIKVLEAINIDAALWDELALAARRPHSQPVNSMPDRLETSTILGLSMGHLQALQKINKLASLRALAAARLGDRQMALNSFAIHFKCRDAAATGPSLIGGLVAISMTSFINNELPDILRSDCLTADDLLWLQGEIESRDDIAMGLSMLRGELALMSYQYDEILKLPKGRRFQAINGSAPQFNVESVVASMIPNSFYTRNHANAIDWLYRYNIEPLKELDFAAMRAAPYELDRQVANAGWFSYGTVLAKQTVPTTGRISAHIIATEMRRQLTITGIAIERFRIKNDNFPPSLEALVPRYLEDVPIDIAAEDSSTPIPIPYELAPDGNSYTLHASPLLPDERIYPQGLQFMR